jgi:hypothetical protein
MAQPIWQTPAGSLGTIPEGIFYEIDLVATVPPDPTPVICTATTAGTNVITCDSTAPLEVGKVVTFVGVPFGGLESYTTYLIYSIQSSTEFQVKDHPDSTSPVTLSTATGSLTGSVSECVYFRLQAGVTPEGMQLDVTGTCYGVPQPVTLLRGVPAEVGADISSKFTVRAYTLTDAGTVDRYIDRTFSITVTGNDPPQWVTPTGSIGSYYDADLVDLQLVYTDPDPGQTVTVRLVSGSLPLGLTVSDQGRIYGYIRPFPDEDQPAGYDLQPYMTAPYDFVSAAISKNYQFTLEVSDGINTDLRIFSIYVYNRSDLTADNDIITADDAFVTADETTVRAPFLTNAEPSDLGVARSGNNWAYRFVGEDYDDDPVEYVFSVNEGFGTPPGLTLDPYSGWFYGNIPDVGITEITYSFNIQVRARSLVITATQAGTNIITCDSNARGDFYVGSPVTFEGAVIGGLAEDFTYYVASIVDDTGFTVSATLGGSAVSLTTETASGLLLCVPAYSPRSAQYPFTLTVSGAVDREVTWLTDSDLGLIENGSVSLLEVEAVSRSGYELFYQLLPGAYNSLPQGLELLPTGEIVGRVSFETFSLDLGSTTIDSSTSTILRRDDTTFDATHTFTVNTYTVQDQVPLYNVNSVKVIDGGTGFTTAPAITFNEPVGASALQATANVAVDGDAITSVTVTESGAEYTSTATYVLSGPGSGADLQVLMQQTGYRRIISVSKVFTVKVVRAYNKPYQNLTIMAMPPQNDRVLLNQLLSDQEIFVPAYIFRPDDPNFGLSTRITYQHAFGLAPETQDTYVESLSLNHYRKNLILGEIKTARALDAAGNVIYEVVYSQIVDDLVNAQGDSVSKIVTTPYAINNPEPPPELINSVYPNSLVNMRDQVIDVVGQISNKLPLWMTSKQTNGQVLGFTPAWVICYTKPNRSQQIAYYISEYFGQQLNLIDFQVDRYVLDRTLSVNWDTQTQQWSPEALQTTFDRVNTSGYTDLGIVNACTELAFDQVNGHNVNEINALGGLDGTTWIAVPGQTPPVGTKVIISSGSKIIFVKQENFGGEYNTDNEAFVNNQNFYDQAAFDQGLDDAQYGTFDYGSLISGGYSSICSATDAATDQITAVSTLGMAVNDKVWFVGNTFGGIDDKTTLDQVQVYYVQALNTITGSSTDSGTDRITVSSVTDLAIDDEIWFAPPVTLAISETSAVDFTVNIGDNSQVLVNMKFVPTQDIGTLVAGTTYYVKTLEGTSKVTLSNSVGGATVNPGTDAGEIVTLIGSVIGSISYQTSAGLPVAYYVTNIVGNQIEISDTQGGAPVALSTDTGVFRIYLPRFSVALTPDANTALSLSSATGSMTAYYGNLRMAIYTITVEVDGTLSLSVNQQTVAEDYVTSNQGLKYANGTYLYRPQSAQQGLSRVNWQPLSTTAPIISDETVFDHGSVQWVEPVDMYDPTDRNDKYLVFPKMNILE